MRLNTPAMAAATFPQRFGSPMRVARRAASTKGPRWSSTR